MLANDLYKGVGVLWGFVAAKSLEPLEGCARRYSIPCYIPALPEVPTWARRNGEQLFFLDFDYGEYEGPFGTLCDRPISWSPRPTEDRLRRAYARKHPSWSNGKIDRAVKDKNASLARGPKWGLTVRSDEQVRSYIEFLRDATQFSSLGFLLTDDSKPLAFLDSSEGKGIFQHATEFDAQTLTEDQILRFPSWVFVLVVRGEAAHSTCKRPDER